MTTTKGKIRDALETTWVVVFLTAMSFIADTAAVYAIVKPVGFGVRTALLAVGVATSLLLLAGVAYSVRVRQQNSRLRSVPAALHRINHDYRDVLSQVFGGQVLPPDKERAHLELRTIESTCQKIAQIFTVLIQRECTVTVKLITKETGRSMCQKYARNVLSCQRDQMRPYEFEVGTTANTAFDEALKVHAGGRTAHFFSPDLLKDKKAGKYENQRPGWEQLYKSVIVVPIRYLDPELVGQTGASDHIGFLAVDTMSTNVLNGSHHVELLASFADQMYNFMSLMRGKYAVPRMSGAVVA